MNRGTESAGILLYRTSARGIEVLIAHPGGPLWASKDEGAWSIPKGVIEGQEAPESAAVREFEEETGLAVGVGALASLGTVRLRSGKTVHAFAAVGDMDPATLESNTFDMEWPPRSGRVQSYPEIDMVMWASPEVARRKLNPAQATLVDRLVQQVNP